MLFYVVGVAVDKLFTRFYTDDQIVVAENPGDLSYMVKSTEILYICWFKY